MFVGTAKNEKRLLEEEEEGKYGLPILILRDSLLVKVGQNQFKSGILEGIFAKGVTFGKRIPTAFYPFSADDPSSYILTEISPILLEMQMNDSEFSEDELLHKAHQYYDYLDKKEKDALRGRIGFILSSIKKDQDFRFVLDRQKKWKIDRDFSPVTLKKAIQEYIRKLEREEEPSKLRATKLGDFASPA